MRCTAPGRSTTIFPSLNCSFRAKKDDGPCYARGASPCAKPLPPAPRLPSSPRLRRTSRRAGNWPEMKGRSTWSGELDAIIKINNIGTTYINVKVKESDIQKYKQQSDLLYVKLDYKEILRFERMSNGALLRPCPANKMMRKDIERLRRRNKI